ALQARVERARLRRRAGGIDRAAREVGRDLLAERHGAAPQQRRLGQALDADAVEALQPEHAAGAHGDVASLRVRAAHEGGGDRRLVRVEAAWVLREQRLRERLDADDLAAIRHRVEIRLEDLALLPGALELRRGHRLAELLADAAAASGPRQALVDEAGELHGQGRCAARARVPEVAPGARRHRLPIDA